MAPVTNPMSSKNNSRPKPIAAKPAPSAGLTLYVSTEQPASRWLELVLAEKDVDGARLLPVTGETPNEDLMVLNPAQSLPTLADREMVIIGPREIAEYLDERYPHPRFMPFARQLGLVGVWEQSGHWPDFCADPKLPYDCRKEAAAGGSAAPHL